MRAGLVGILALVLLAAPAAAQTDWDAPSFLAPRAGDDIGVYLSGGIGDFGIQGIWRSGGLGVRGGYVSNVPISSFEDEDLFLLGAEAFGRVLTAGAGFPVDAALMAGIGATFGELTVIRIPAGLSVGLVLPFQGMSLVPYVHPKVGLNMFTDAQDEFATDLNFVLDFGADLVMSGFTLRGGATTGEGGTVYGFGIAFNAARGVAVR